jgi:hypothetical protein
VPSAAAPPTEPLDVVLHIGSGKTGTSSIQHFLHTNRARLADLGYLYPKTPGRLRHIRLGLSLLANEALPDSPDRRQVERFASPEAFRRAFRRRLFREINQSGLSQLVLSDEGLWGLPDDALPRLSRFTRRIAGSFRVVVYLRRQDDHLVSRYQQVVKLNETRRLVDRMEQVEWSRTYDYHSRIRTWRRLVEPDEFVIRRFERDSFVDRSLLQDFLTAAGIDARADELEGVEPHNESLDAESVEFLRILNLLRVEEPTLAPLVGGNFPLIPRLAIASTGPTLTLPTQTLDTFMAQWEESNRRVAVEMLGDESGQLFHGPRRTRNRTTEQHLDPGRLEHFLTLLELPEQVHAPLRTLVERESKVR